MSVASTIFLFLLVGSQFTYVYHFYMTNGFIVFNGKIIWNLTWEGDIFNATGTVDYILINGSQVKNYSYNISESQNQYLHDWYTLTTIFFPYFVVNSYSLGYYNGSIPSITLRMSRDSNIVISAQYGFPLEGQWIGNRGGFNTTYNFTLVKSPLTLSDYRYSVYKVNISKDVEFTILTPNLVRVSKASYTIQVMNSSVTFPGMSIVGRGFLTFIFPSYEVSEFGGLAALFYNGSKYFVGLSQNTVEYMNSTNPFFITVLGHYVFMFFPYGGNVTLIFYDPKMNVSISVSEISGGSTTYTNYVILGVIAAAVLGLGTVLVLRVRRPS
mgnify:CR=1 FL=1